MRKLINLSSVFVLLTLFLTGQHGFAGSDRSPLENISGTAIFDVKINDDTGTAEQKDPAIAMSRSGWGVVVWTDSRSGYPRIYTQIVSSKGLPFKGNLEVHSLSGSLQQNHPDVAVNDLGHFVVVWDDNRSGNYDIYAQRFAANGEPIGSDFKVNSNTSSTNETDPAIAMTGAGDFVVCWTDLRNSRYDIYAQRYSAEGSPVGSNFQVNDVASYSRRNSDIDMNQAGQFVIAWQDARNALVDYVYARRYNASGVAQGAPFKVNLDLIGEKQHILPSVAVHENGDFMISYVIVGLVDVLYGHLYASDGSSLIDYFQVPETGTSANNSAPDVCTNSNGGYSFVWETDRDGTYDIYGRNFNAAGSAAGASVRVSDAAGNQLDPAIAIDNRGIALMVWEDDRNGNMDIFGCWIGPIAPLNVTAGSGFNAMVPLSWDFIYGVSDTKIYHIYRSTTSGGPYTSVATVDLSTRGVLGGSMRDWIDTGVTNGTTYYYKISAMVGSVESFKSTEVSATPSATGYEIECGWATSAPTIDGNINSSEWSAATTHDISNPSTPSTVTLYTMNDGTHLYLAIDDPNDAVIDGGNIWGFLFDEDNNDAWDASGPSNEGLLTISNAAAIFTGYWGTYPNSLGADLSKVATGVVKGISTTSGHVQYEASFDLTTSALNAAPGETIGFGTLLDDPSNFYLEHYGYTAEWPYGLLWEAAPPLGDLTLASGSTSISISLSLHNGWNMFSINVDPPDPSLDVIMLPILSKIVIMKNNAGQNFIPDYGINTIGDISYEEGYQLYLRDAATLTVTGQILAWDTPISLGAGWNMVSYIPDMSIDAAIALSSIASELVLAKNNAGQSYLPAYGINQIGQMQPGEGYQMYLSAASTLTYPSGAVQNSVSANRLPGASNASDKASSPSHFKFASKTAENATLVLPAEIIPSSSDGALLKAGDEIGVFNSKGICCGASVWDGASTAITIWGDDSQTDAPDGLVNGEDFHIRVWKKRAQQEVTASVQFLREQPLAYQPNGIFVIAQFKLEASSDIASTGDDAVPSSFKLLQNYPNPFNPETTIEYHLPQSAEVRLTIYDLQGQTVRQLLRATQSAGFYQIQWDGRDEAGNLAASSVYFYRIEMMAKTTGGYSFVDVKKLILMK
ncbi:T9SS type A sorting domain-containing protein [candidate division KSB1 bacterium]|nr:T9SS type A sorting domain-containing protein [candidate division KSB1 bacterium]